MSMIAEERDAMTESRPTYIAPTKGEPGVVAGLLLDLTMTLLVVSTVFLWLGGRMDAYAKLADLSLACGSELRRPRATELLKVFSARELPAFR